MKENKLAKELYGKYYEENKCNVDFTVCCTGKSTALALQLISVALANPCQEVGLVERGRIMDSKPGGFVDQVEQVIKKLGLRFAKVNREKHTLMFDIFGEQGEVDELSLLKAKLVEAATVGDLHAVTTYSQAIQRIQSTN